MRQYYVQYSIGATVSHQLSWSHAVELLKIEDPLERSFYEKQTEIENWTVRELIRQKKTSLFLRHIILTPVMCRCQNFSTSTIYMPAY